MNIGLPDIQNSGIVSAKNFGYGSGYSGFVLARNTY